MNWDLPPLIGGIPLQSLANTGKIKGFQPLDDKMEVCSDTDFSGEIMVLVKGGRSDEERPDGKDCTKCVDLLNLH